MGHGIYMNSLGFVASRNKTIVYQAVQAGYQVFLINYRGTRYSVTAGNLTQNDRAYWSYSFHQMGIYDLPATTALVYNMTKSKSVYIGFSMGTTISYIYSSLNSTDASEKLLGIISMAPVATVTHMRSLVRFLAPFWQFIGPIVEAIFNGRALPRLEALGRLCASTPGTILFCETFFKLPLFGDDYVEVDPLYRPVFDIINPEAIAGGVVTHYSQIILSGRFQQFDHGPEENLQLYGTAYPPLYNLTNIPVKVALFVGPNDWLATPKNAVRIYDNLSNSSRCGFTYVNWSKWNHVDFVTAVHLLDYVTLFVLEKVQSMQSNVCT